MPVSNRTTRFEQRHDAGVRTSQPYHNHNAKQDVFELAGSDRRGWAESVAAPPCRGDADNSGTDNGAQVIGEQPITAMKRYSMPRSNRRKAGIDEAQHVCIEPAGEHSENSSNDEDGHLVAGGIDAEGFREVIVTW